MHTKLNFLSYDITFVENRHHMRKLHAFETKGLKDSRMKSCVEYRPVLHRASHGDPVNPVPPNVMGEIFAAQHSVGIPVPISYEHLGGAQCSTLA